MYSKVIGSLQTVNQETLLSLFFDITVKVSLTERMFVLKESLLITSLTV